MRLSSTGLFLALCLILSGCFGTEEAPKGSPAFLPYGDSLPNPMTVEQDRYFEYAPSGDLADTTFELKGNKPSWLSFDATTGKISGCPSQIEESEELTLEVKKGTDVKTYGPFKVAVNGDPFTRSAWHLSNSGQTTFSKNPGTAGEDMKVRDALCTGVSGKGIHVVVSDTGMEVAHDDLKDNVFPNKSKNYVNSLNFTQDPGVFTEGGLGDHGTSVSGIIASKGGNGIGAHGIAPDAKISGVNFIANPGDAQLMDQIDLDVDAINQSWGFVPSGIYDVNKNLVGYNVRPTGSDADYEAQLKFSANTYRAGKGTIVVRSAGNDYRFPYSLGPTVLRPLNAGWEFLNNSYYSIVVGAMNAIGRKASYSSAGSSLWVSGLGGEFGSNTPAIFTTDLMGCATGYARSAGNFPMGYSIANQFETGLLGNSGCHYTTIFNGTSSAAPSVSGVVALMLQANPNLSFRDVKYILAKTATKVDPDFDKVGLTNPNYANDPPWRTNQAGFNFHNWYGFGRVDALAAVNMARTYTGSWGPLKETVNGAGTWLFDSGAINQPIKDNDLVNPTATSTINVTQQHSIEAVQIRVTITHPLMGDVGIELTSPAGTKSLVVNPVSAFNQANFNNVMFITNAFYGETSQGNWTIKVMDGVANTTGTLTNWKINILGHTP